MCKKRLSFTESRLGKENCGGKNKEGLEIFSMELSTAERKKISSVIFFGKLLLCLNYQVI